MRGQSRLLAVSGQYSDSRFFVTLINFKVLTGAGLVDSSLSKKILSRNLCPEGGKTVKDASVGAPVGHREKNGCRYEHDSRFLAEATRYVCALHQ